MLAKAAAEMVAAENGGGSSVGVPGGSVQTPAVIAEWLFKSELYSTLTRQINDIDVSGQVAAGVAVEAQTRADNDQAVMEAINTAWAAIGVNNALIQSGEAIQTNWNATQASKWSQLEAEVFTSGGVTIRQALANEATVRSNADGSLFAQWTVKIDQNGNVSGFGLASEAPDGSGPSTSTFAVNANKFVITDPVSGIVPFYVDNGVPIFTGTVYAHNGVFGGSLSAATGTFAGALAAGVIDFSALAGTSDSYTAGVHTITVPNNPDWNGVSLRVTLQGAGGGGGGANTWSGGIYHLAGGGGEAGEWVSQIIDGLTAGETLTLTVGTGGLVSQAGVGGKGGDSFIQSGASVLALAEGGNPGQPGTQSHGGYGGAGIPGAQDGAQGQAIFDNNAFAQGGVGGSSIYGSGGTGTGGTGAGGGGVSMNQFSNRTGGGNGGNGYAVVEFYDANVVVLRTTYNNLISWLDSTVSPVPSNAR